MIDAMVGEFTHIKYIIAFVTVSINYTIRHNFSFDNKQ